MVNFKKLASHTIDTVDEFLNYIDTTDTSAVVGVPGFYRSVRFDGLSEWEKEFIQSAQHTHLTEKQAAVVVRIMKRHRSKLSAMPFSDLDGLLENPKFSIPPRPSVPQSPPQARYVGFGKLAIKAPSWAWKKVTQNPPRVMRGHPGIRCFNPAEETTIDYVGKLVGDVDDNLLLAMSEHTDDTQWARLEDDRLIFRTTTFGSVMRRLRATELSPCVYSLPATPALARRLVSEDTSSYYKIDIDSAVRRLAEQDLIDDALEQWLVDTQFHMSVDAIPNNLSSRVMRLAKKHGIKKTSLGRRGLNQVSFSFNSDKSDKKPEPTPVEKEFITRTHMVGLEYDPNPLPTNLKISSHEQLGYSIWVGYQHSPLAGCLTRYYDRHALV